MKFTQKSINNILNEVQRLVFNARNEIASSEEIANIISAKALMKSLELIGAMPTIGANEKLEREYKFTLGLIEQYYASHDNPYDEALESDEDESVEEYPPTETAYAIKINGCEVLHFYANDLEAIKDFVLRIRQSVGVESTARLTKDGLLIANAVYVEGYPDHISDAIKIGDNCYLKELYVNYTFVSQINYKAYIRELLSDIQSGKGPTYVLRRQLWFMLPPVYDSDLYNECRDYLLETEAVKMNTALVLNSGRAQRNSSTVIDALIMGEDAMQTIEYIYTDVGLYYNDVLVAVSKYYKEKPDDVEDLIYLKEVNAYVTRFKLTPNAPLVFGDLDIAISEFISDSVDYEPTDLRASRSLDRAEFLLYYMLQLVSSKQELETYFFDKEQISIMRTSLEIERSESNVKN